MSRQFFSPRKPSGKSARRSRTFFPPLHRVESADKQIDLLSSRRQGPTLFAHTQCSTHRPPESRRYPLTGRIYGRLGIMCTRSKGEDVGGRVDAMLSWIIALNK